MTTYFWNWRWSWQVGGFRLETIFIGNVSKFWNIKQWALLYGLLLVFIFYVLNSLLQVDLLSFWRNVWVRSLNDLNGIFWIWSILHITVLVNLGLIRQFICPSKHKYKMLKIRQNLVQIRLNCTWKFHLHCSHFHSLWWQSHWRPSQHGTVGRCTLRLRPRIQQLQTIMHISNFNYNLITKVILKVHSLIRTWQINTSNFQNKDRIFHLKYFKNTLTDFILSKWFYFWRTAIKLFLAW